MSSVPGAFALTSAAQTQAALSAEMVKMNLQAAQGLAALLEQNAELLKEAAAAPAPGTGIALDRSA